MPKAPNLAEWRQPVGVGACTGADAGVTGSTGVGALSLDHSEVVSRAHVGFEKQGRPAAAQLSLRNDGDAVAQQLGLVHVVSRQDDGAICSRIKLLLYNVV